MTASQAFPPVPPIPTVRAAQAAVADRAHTELRRLLLSHLALDVHPHHLAGVVIRLCAELSPLLARPAVSVGARERLSDRELQVLVGMAGGSANAEIGRKLRLSEDTVKTYARRLYANLGGAGPRPRRGPRLPAGDPRGRGSRSTRTGSSRPF